MNYIISLLAMLQAGYYMRRVNQETADSPWEVRLIYFELIYNLIIKFIVGNTAAPSALNYVSDLVLLMILFGYLRRTGGRIREIPRSLLALGGGLLALTLVSYALNLYSPLLYLWGLRNNFRFVLFAMMCAAYLTRRDIDRIMEILFGFFLTNIAVVTFQFLTLDHYRQSFGDFISGLFSNGGQRGGNESLAWLICIVCTWETVKFLNEGVNLGRLIACWLGALYMAALAEIKLVILLLVLSCGMALLLCRKTKRSVALIGFSVLALFIGVQILYLIFPKFDQFFTLERMLSYVTNQEGYASSGVADGLDRLTAIPYVYENYLHTWSERLFGIGLGNADYSGFAFLTSPFYVQNSWTGYSFFSSAFLTLELGAIGMLGFMIWYVNSACVAFSLRTGTIWEKSVRDAGIIFGLTALLILFTNQSLKLESAAFTVNCILIFPFLLCKPLQEEEEAEKEAAERALAAQRR